MKLNNNTEIQSMTDIDSLSTLDNEQMFAEVAGMIRQTRQNVIRIAYTAIIEPYLKVGEYLSRKIADAEWRVSVNFTDK